MIKLFEDYNSLYELVSEYTWRRDNNSREAEEFTSRDMKQMNDIFSYDPKVKGHRQLYCIYCFNKSSSVNAEVKNFVNFSIQIFKREDEWFFISNVGRKYHYNNRGVYLISTDIESYYKCDGIEGCLEALNSIKDSYIKFESSKMSYEDHIKPYSINDSKIIKSDYQNSWEHLLSEIKPGEYCAIQNNEISNTHIKILFDNLGDVISMTPNEIESIDKILWDYKDMNPGKHYSNGPSGSIDYPPIRWRHTNCRSGHCWFLKRNKDRYNMEFMLNKFSDDWYTAQIIVCTDNYVDISDKRYVCDTILGVSELIEKEILPLYKNIKVNESTFD